jgi:fatty acid desaturase
MADQGPQLGKHAAHFESHGHSVAAWTAVTFILIGALVMALAVIWPSVPWFVVGAVVVIVGLAAGKVLAMAGYGDKKDRPGPLEPTAGTR